MLLRFDPFRELDRLSDEVGRRRPTTTTVPMDAVRADDRIVLRFDVPGVATDDLDLSVEQDTLTLTVERAAGDGDALVRERPTGRSTRRLRLGDTLDTDRLEADHADGVLTVRIPLREQTVARKVAIGTGEAVEATAA